MMPHRGEIVMKTVVRFMLVMFMLVMAGCGQVAPDITPPSDSNDGVKLTIDRAAMTRSSSMSTMSIDPKDFAGQRWLLVTITTNNSSLYFESPIRELKAGESLIPVTISLPSRSDYIVTAVEFTKHLCGEKCVDTFEVIGLGAVYDVSVMPDESKVVNVTISPIQYDYEYPLEVEGSTAFSGSLTLVAGAKIKVSDVTVLCNDEVPSLVALNLLRYVHKTSSTSVMFQGKWTTAISYSGMLPSVTENTTCSNPRLRVELSNIDRHYSGYPIEYRIVAPSLSLQHDALPNIVIRKSTGGITF